MANSISLDAFVRGVRRLWPTATVWTKGDKAHERSPSDHNNDDTAGVKPEQTDSDSKPEVRAADVPTLGGVTMAMLDELRVRLTTRPANQRRLRYVILRQHIWRKRNGWKREDYTGDYHGHLHASLDVADDDNGAPWDLDPAAPPAPSSTPRGIGMFLIHKRVSGVVTFALVGPALFSEWRADEMLTTSAGSVDGQTFANELAQLLGDSDEKSAVVFEAIKARVTA